MKICRNLVYLTNLCYSNDVDTVYIGFQEDVQMLKMNGDRIPVLNMYCGNQPVFICEKAVSNVNAVTH